MNGSEAETLHVILNQIRNKHCKTHGDRCMECGHRYPCQTVQLIDEREPMRLAAYRAARGWE